jgi:hypothetical protein
MIRGALQKAEAEKEQQEEQTDIPLYYTDEEESSEDYV